MLNFIMNILCFCVLCVIANQCSNEHQLEHNITKVGYFQFKGQEWQCGLTPRQVEINLLEDKIRKIKE